MITKKDLNFAEMDILTKSCSPTIVITANGEVQTNEEATGYVKELDFFLTVNSSMIRQLYCHRRSFARNMHTLTSGPAVTNHTSLTMVFGYSVIRRIRCRSWSLAYQHLLHHQIHLLLHLQHHQRRILKIRYQIRHQFEVRVRIDQH